MGAVEEDPFAIFLRPPSNESAGERAERLAREAQAKKVSDQIDEQLKAERAAMKKQRDTVRVLLLGQSESGKSTTLKNFRMHYARQAWDAERASWRAVIQLNVIRSIIMIVETLQAEMDGDPFDQPPATPATPKTGIPSFAQENPAHEFEQGRSSSASTSSAVPDSPAGLSRHNNLTLANNLARSSISSLLTDKHQLLKVRLGPLRRVEADLQRRLGAATLEEQDGAAAGHGPLGVDGIDGPIVNRKLRSEFSVRRLNDALEHSRLSTYRNGSQHGHGSDPDSPVGPSGRNTPSGDEPTEVLASCLDDMKALWSDDAVRVVLKRRKVRLEETAGFFLDDLDRIVQRDYIPTDDDVVRARLRTLSVQEYRIRFEQPPSSGIGANMGKEWLLYDVGGSRTLRNAWIPFFDNIQAIIFLAPVSCFDERLSEDSRVNRLEDSFLLWRSICSSKLLARTCVILFLNKCDLLRKKLKAGVQVKKYLPSYGDRPNDPSSVVKYLREKFKEILRQHSPEARSSYFYATSVVDTKATASTIKAVRDSILKDYLKSAELM